ncbi:MlrC C-terminal domain-containing protein [Paracoccus cavernae]|uniref:MlrC C-terminal domain-containing protein n=1 Tax=Paracoccus cavernae TaxID=1571207 RepID=UPI0036404C80
MDVLEAALEAGLGGIVAGPFHDPQAVAEAFAAGSGSEITLELGNKIAAEGFPRRALRCG